MRFDFTGLGASEWEFANTSFSSNVADLVAAADALRRTRRAPAILIGHSFGANMALMYAPYDLRIRTVVAIGLLLYRVGSGFPKAFEPPKLFVTGEYDQVCPRDKLELFVEQQSGRKGMKVITGASHLMRGYEEPTVDAIMKYMKKWAAMEGVK